jgi:hypothetical protein
MLKSITIGVSAAFACAALLVSGSAEARMSDAQVRAAMMRESLASYPGNCPCPYNTDRAGRSCGRRSAHSRPGGYAPLCYPRDISKVQVEAYRRQHGS